MNTLFLDTGFLVALETSDDSNHREAKQIWDKVLANRCFVVTTTFVFDEMATFFNSRGFHSKAVEIGNILLKSSSILVHQVEEELFTQAWGFFCKHKDKSYSFTDCVSFLTMKKRRIKKALAFDKHFRQAGFEIVSTESFPV